MNREATTRQADDLVTGRRSIWRRRRRRLLSGANACVSILLALVLLVLVNGLAQRYNKRWNISRQGYYQLSDKTRSMLASLDGEIHVAAFFRKSHILCDDVNKLLQEYQYAASLNPKLKFNVSIIDPDRDLIKNRELVERFDIQNANVVVFEKEGRRKYVEDGDIGEYALTMKDNRAFTQLVGFKAEQVFSSALLSISQLKQPRVYFLTGHGERDGLDFRKNVGYSQLARLMHRDNMKTDRLVMAEHGGIPVDCDVLVIAGPDRRILREEVDWLAEYLAAGGRVFLLLDPVVDSGLDALLAVWGIGLSLDVVVDPRRTLTGRELLVTGYGEHVITRALNGVATVFYMPRSITPSVAQDARRGQADRPQVAVLAASGPDGWAEMDLQQSPAEFDENVDRRGPVPLAVAVERGRVGEIEVGIKPTRLVVVGDSDFVSNGALAGGAGGNLDFFMSGMNWLLEREALMAIDAKPPLELRLDMNRARLRVMSATIIGIEPLLLLALGLMVWRMRRF